MSLSKSIVEEDKKTADAKAAYATLCAMLDEKKWRYKKDEEKLNISCSYVGDDLTEDIRMHINAEMQIVTLYSELPFTVLEEDRVAMAMAVSVVNYALVDGSFDFSLATGRIVFRLTSSYRESLISKEMCKYMLEVSCTTVDEYNDKLFMVSKKAMSLQDLLKSLE